MLPDGRVGGTRSTIATDTNSKQTPSADTGRRPAAGRLLRGTLHRERATRLSQLERVTGGGRNVAQHGGRKGLAGHRSCIRPKFIIRKTADSGKDGLGNNAQEQPEDMCDNRSWAWLWNWCRAMAEAAEIMEPEGGANQQTSNADESL